MYIHRNSTTAVFLGRVLKIKIYLIKREEVLYGMNSSMKRNEGIVG